MRLLATSLTVLLLGQMPATVSAACELITNESVCLPRTVPQLHYCIRQLNTLKQVMDCVSYDGRSRVDNRVCHTDGTCYLPRDVLISATSMRTCAGCSLGGLFKVCPDADPNFHQCLCNHHLHPDVFNCLQRCFLQTTVEDLRCFPFAKRNEQHAKRTDLEPPPGLIAMKRDLFVLEGANFYLDDYARPVYPDGSIGYPLPYYDRVIRSGTAMRRCFISPENNDRWCMDWQLLEPIEGDFDGGYYTGGSYGGSYDDYGEHTAEEEDNDDDEYPEPTRTAAPATTTPPSLSAVTETLPPDDEGDALEEGQDAEDDDGSDEGSDDENAAPAVVGVSSLWLLTTSVSIGLLSTRLWR